MRRFAPLLLVVAAACDLAPPCPTIAFVGGSPHSDQVAIAETLVARHPAGGQVRICYRLAPIGSYEQIDQPDAEVALAESVAADPHVVVVVGHLRSAGSMAAAPVYARVGIPQIVPAATNHLLRTLGPWTFVLAPSDEDQAAYLAGVVDSMHLRRVEVFYSGEAYGEGMAQSLLPLLARRHLAVVDTVRLGIGTDIPTLVEAAMQRHPADVVLILGDYNQAAEVARTAVSLHPGIRLLASDGADYEQRLRRIGGAAAESLYIVRLWHPDTTVASIREFLAVFRRLSSREPASSEALDQDAFLYARAAILAAGPDRSAIRTWLAGAAGSKAQPDNITGHTLHDGPPPVFGLFRIGPPRLSAPASH